MIKLIFIEQLIDGTFSSPHKSKIWHIPIMSHEIIKIYIKNNITTTHRNLFHPQRENFLNFLPAYIFQESLFCQRWSYLLIYNENIISFSLLHRIEKTLKGRNFFGEQRENFMREKEAKCSGKEQILKFIL